ncbi:hypothetical protein [Streptosporangium canum]|uniref:hypothetical protein n=1 Tax=Streptosporangium canum TaxID=324952 RepID=UPI003438CBD8
MERWIKPLLGRHRLDKLTPEHLDQAYSTMLERGLSSSTVLKVHRVLSRALKIAIRRNKVTKNVATLIDAPVANDPDLEPLTRNEARKILEAAKSRRNAAMVGRSLAGHPTGGSTRPAVVLRGSGDRCDQGVVPGAARLRRSSRVRRGVASPAVQEAVYRAQTPSGLPEGLQAARSRLPEADVSEGMHRSSGPLPQADGWRHDLPAA